MDDASWLDSCRQKGQLNETDVKRWVAARTEQIRNSALLLSLSPALAIVAILCILCALLLITLALRRRSIQLRQYAFLINQHLVDLLTLGIIVAVGATSELRDAFNSIGFLCFLICVFAFVNIGLSQISSTLLNFLRLDCQSFYSRIRIEYVLTSCIVLWFLCAICALVFSPLFFVLEFAQRSNQQECMFYSCQSPLLLSFLLIMAIVWFANLISYAATLARLYKRVKKERKQQSDVSLADQVLKHHWLSIGAVTLFSAIGVVTLFVVAALARAIFEMHQLRALHMQCQMSMRLNLISQMQALGSSLLVLWVLRAACVPLVLIVSDFKNLVTSSLIGKLASPKSMTASEQPIKIHCCAVDKVSWCRTV